MVGRSPRRARVPQAPGPGARPSGEGQDRASRRRRRGVRQPLCGASVSFGVRDPSGLREACGAAWGSRGRFLYGRLRVRPVSLPPDNRATGSVGEEPWERGSRGGPAGCVRQAGPRSGCGERGARARPAVLPLRTRLWSHAFPGVPRISCVAVVDTRRCALSAGPRGSLSGRRLVEARKGRKTRFSDVLQEAKAAKQLGRMRMPYLENEQSGN